MPRERTPIDRSILPTPLIPAQAGIQVTGTEMFGQAHLGPRFCGDERMQMPANARKSSGAYAQLSAPFIPAQPESSPRPLIPAQAGIQGHFGRDARMTMAFFRT